MDNVEQWWTTGEAARHISVHTKTIKRWRLAGLIRPADYYTTPGGHYRWNPAAIRKLRRHTPPAPQDD